jgi:hypothetical protein
VDRRASSSRVVACLGIIRQPGFSDTSRPSSSAVSRRPPGPEFDLWLRLGKRMCRGGKNRAAPGWSPTRTFHEFSPSSRRRPRRFGVREGWRSFARNPRICLLGGRFRLGDLRSLEFGRSEWILVRLPDWRLRELWLATDNTPHGPQHLALPPDNLLQPLIISRSSRGDG